MRTNSPQHLAHGRAAKLDGGDVLLDEKTIESSVDFAEMFGNSRPVEIEIGTGKGTFLLARAKARPEVNFLGIEYAGVYSLYSADRFRRHKLDNIRMLHADAGLFFKQCIAPGALSRVHIYFPDPWPKRRHRRRRLIQLPFVALARRALRIGGQFIVVTDHRGYFEQISGVLHSAEGFATVPVPSMADADGEIVGTNFERKYIAQGRPFYSAARLKYR